MGEDVGVGKYKRFGPHNAGVAYRDCYRWLYRVCPPWRWLLAAGSVWVPLPLPDRAEHQSQLNEKVWSWHSFG